MLKSFEDTGWRIDKIEDLKYKLDCPVSYANYAIFKEKVLDMAHKEINNSDIFFTYEPIKTGRKVTSIKFNITSNKNKSMNEIAVTSISEELKLKQDLELVKQVQVIVKDTTGNEITDKVAYTFYSRAVKHKQYGEKPLELIAEVAEYSKTQNMEKGFVAWFIGTVGHYIRPTRQTKTSTDTFNNYDQRKYDYNDLEKKLLGYE